MTHADLSAHVTGEPNDMVVDGPTTCASPKAASSPTTACWWWARRSASAISAFDVETDGSLAARQVWASFPTYTDLTAAFDQLSVAPAGCGLDAEGALWLADALARPVLRIRRGGEIVIGTGVFACMLGSSERRALFLCTGPHRAQRLP